MKKFGDYPIGSIIVSEISSISLFNKILKTDVWDWNYREFIVIRREIDRIQLYSEEYAKLIINISVIHAYRDTKNVSRCL